MESFCCLQKPMKRPLTLFFIMVWKHKQNLSPSLASTGSSFTLNDGFNTWKNPGHFRAQHSFKEKLKCYNSVGKIFLYIEVLTKVFYSDCEGHYMYIFQNMKSALQLAEILPYNSYQSLKFPSAGFAAANWE